MLSRQLCPGASRLLYKLQRSWRCRGVVLGPRAVNRPPSARPVPRESRAVAEVGSGGCFLPHPRESCPGRGPGLSRPTCPWRSVPWAAAPAGHPPRLGCTGKTPASPARPLGLPHAFPRRCGLVAGAAIFLYGTGRRHVTAPGGRGADAQGLPCCGGRRAEGAGWPGCGQPGRHRGGHLPSLSLPPQIRPRCLQSCSTAALQRRGRAAPKAAGTEGRGAPAGHHRPCPRTGLGAHGLRLAFSPDARLAGVPQAVVCFKKKSTRIY